MRSHRWIVVVAVGLAAFLVASAGSYLGARSFRGSQASQSCDIYRCIPRLDAVTVVEALKGQGHTCKQDYNHWNCELRVGQTGFKASLQISGELIARIDAEVRNLGGDSVSPAGMAYLNWFAIMPYARDSATMAQIEDWLRQQVEGVEDSEATIGDYQYRLTNPDPESVALLIEGKS